MISLFFMHDSNLVYLAYLFSAYFISRITFFYIKYVKVIILYITSVDANVHIFNFSFNISTYNFFNLERGCFEFCLVFPFLLVFCLFQ